MRSWRGGAGTSHLPGTTSVGSPTARASTTIPARLSSSRTRSLTCPPGGAEGADTGAGAGATRVHIVTVQGESVGEGAE